MDSAYWKITGNALYLFEMNGEHNWWVAYSPGYERFSIVSKEEKEGQKHNILNVRENQAN